MLDGALGKWQAEGRPLTDVVINSVTITEA